MLSDHRFDLEGEGMTLKALVVDDEPFARNDLRELCRHQPDLQIEWEAGSMLEASQILREAQPDVVFLDVQLGDGCGFDLLPMIPDTTQVVFVSAYDQYALRAFEVNALDYLLKPVSFDRFSQCIARLVQRIASTDFPETAPLPVTCDDRLLIRHGGKREFIPVANVVVVTSLGGNYSQVCRVDGAWFDVRRTIKDWETILPQDHFVRVHRSTIVNLDHVEHATRKLGGGFRLKIRQLADPILVSRRQAHAIEMATRKNRLRCGPKSAETTR
jgi:two-component system LytT family response regulator